MQTTQEVITPEKATEWIDTVDAVAQRKAKPAVVQKYAKDMEAGKWMNTGMPFVFDSYGRMIDGQHRCLAVIRSGKTLPFPVNVVRGVDSSAIDKIDRGASRTMRDVVQIALGDRRYAKAGELAALRLKVVDGVRSVTDSEIVALAERMDCYKWALDAFPTAIKGLTVTAVKLAVAEMWALNPIKAEEFAEKLKTGADLSKGDAILTLRNYLLSANTKVSNRKDIYRKTVSACLHYLRGAKAVRFYGADWDPVDTEKIYGAK